MNRLPNRVPYSVAVSFFDAAKILERQEGDFTEVIVMQYAFAAELSLKSFFIKKNSPVQLMISVSENDPNFLLKDQALTIEKNGHGHDLEKIFSLMDLSVQNKLRAFFHEETSQDLDELIKKCAEYFVRSRYWLEMYGVLDLTSAKTLSSGLIHAISRYFQEVGED